MADKKARKERFLGGFEKLRHLHRRANSRSASPTPATTNTDTKTSKSTISQTNAIAHESSIHSSSTQICNPHATNERTSMARTPSTHVTSTAILKNDAFLEWEDLWIRAHMRLKESEPEVVREYLSNLVTRPEYMPQGQTQSGTFTIDSKSVMSVITKLDQQRTDDQWRIKWTTGFLKININLRKQVQKLVKFAMWSDTIVKQALSTQPYAALAWSGATMILPVRLTLTTTIS